MKIGMIFGLVSAVVLAGCDQTPARPTADQVQHQQQERLSQQGNMVAGMPAITNFFEKKLMKTILEMRDNPNLNTFTYIVDMQGKMHLMCNSIGYGLPYATQYTNPLQDKWYARGAEGISGVTIAQADPNGLFSPSSADGTWVLCKNPHGTDLKPVYIEPRIVVSPFPLD